MFKWMFKIVEKYFIVSRYDFFLKMYFFPPEYFATLGTVWRDQSSQLLFTPQLSRDPANHFKNLPGIVIRLWTLPDHHSGEEYPEKRVLHHFRQSMGFG